MVDVRPRSLWMSSLGALEDLAWMVSNTTVERAIMKSKISGEVGTKIREQSIVDRLDEETLRNIRNTGGKHISRRDIISLRRPI